MKLTKEKDRMQENFNNTLMYNIKTEHLLILLHIVSYNN